MKAWERETELQRKMTEQRAELFFTRVVLGLLLAIVVVVLTGCAERIDWFKQGGNFQAESYLCERDAIALGGTAYVGFGMTERVANYQVYVKCMLASGWTIVNRTRG